MSDENQTEGDLVATPIAAPGSPSTLHAPPSTRSFDVALVDPHNPAVEHWPRVRVTVEAATLDELTDEQKAPPAAGESAEAEAKRLAFLVADIERRRAIAAYNDTLRLTDSHLRYDVVAAAGDAPALSAEWTDHLRHIHQGKPWPAALAAILKKG